MDYKDTLNMPKTDFEMKGNLAKKEPGILEEWEKKDLYNEIVKRHKDKTPFILHDGPPYANNNLHAGTAMNRTIKDFIVRSHFMLGYNSEFFPGWDTHGLPIENAIQKQGVDRKAMSPAEFRSKCEEYAKAQIEIQKATEKRLGQIGDFDNPYITLDKHFEARQIRSFAKMALKGLIFQGLKPIYWSPFNETAVADSEIVYFDKTDPTIYVTFEVEDGKGVLDKGDKIVIWTTTPWTIPANQAIAVNPDFEYAVFKTEKGNLVFLKSKKEELLAKFGLEGEEVKTFKGSDIERVTIKHPLYDRLGLVALADYVGEEDGTGCVHIAPDHGLDDFYACQPYGIGLLETVDEKGCMTSVAGPELEGLFVDDCSKKVITLLSDCESLMAVEEITHSYPHDDRLKKPVIFRATKQWFCSIEKIREELLDQIQNHVHWYNEWGQIRMYNMIKERGDWCISRQRLWGVPIPIIYCEDGTPIMEEEVFNHIAELFDEYGSNVWFEREAKDLLPEGYTNPGSPNGTFTKEKDIMDVWFDSGSSHNELQARGYGYPCDIYFEGSDQYRGWFNSSLIVGTATNGCAPYKSVLSHGYVVDSKGEKMSKSLGNGVDPMDIINVNGADVFRLWAMLSDFRQDVRLGETNIKQATEQYRKVRNTFKFLLGNLNESDFDPKNDMVPYEELELVDKQIINALNEVIRQVREYCAEFDYVATNRTLMNFMTNELSSYYCSFTKDILYCNAKEDKRRRQVQSVYWNACDALVRLWAPFLCFTTEEVWKYFSNDAESSVHFMDFPEVQEHDDAKELEEKFEKLQEIRSDVMKALEEARNEKQINSAQEAKVVISCSNSEKELLEETLNKHVAQWLIVSQVEYRESDTRSITIEKAEGTKCPRCWNYDVDADEDDDLCPRCKMTMVLVERQNA